MATMDYNKPINPTEYLLEQLNQLPSPSSTDPHANERNPFDSDVRKNYNSY